MHFSIADYMQKSDDGIAKFNRACFFARDQSLQKEAIEILQMALSMAAVIKQQAIGNANEIQANVCLSDECMFRALMSELSMLVALKTDDSNQAWDHLVDAQEFTVRAAVAEQSKIAFANENLPRLNQIEKLLFPPQIFASPAIKVEITTCSICDTTYGKCDHVDGLSYMGEFCYQRIDSVSDYRELSIVEQPKSKKLRVRAFTSKGITKDWLSFRQIEFEPGPKDDTNAENGIVFSYTWEGA